MRFENSAVDGFRIDSGDLDDLRCAAETAHDSDSQVRRACEFCQKSDDRLIRFTVHWGRGNVEFPGFAELSGEFGLASPCPNLKREPRFHLSLFATRYARANR
jgi:hypothetical protein